MTIEVAVPLALSVLTAIVLSARALLQQGAQVLRLLTKLQEDVKVCLVGLEALRMVDTDTDARQRSLEQRVEDLERYLELASSGDWPHPFKIRQPQGTHYPKIPRSQPPAV